jgi:hypothetical protein
MTQEKPQGPKAARSKNHAQKTKPPKLARLAVKLPPLDAKIDAKPDATPGSTHAAVQPKPVETGPPPAPEPPQPAKIIPPHPPRTGRYSDFSPAMVRGLWSSFALLLLGLLVAELFIPSHAEFGLAATPFFHAWFALLAALVIALLAWLAGTCLPRPCNTGKRSAS